MTGWSGLTALPSVCSRFSDGQRLVRFNSNVVGRGKGKGRHGLSNFDWRIEAQQSRLRPERISPRTIEAGGDGISLRDKFRRAAGRQFYDLPRNRGLLHCDIDVQILRKKRGHLVIHLIRTGVGSDAGGDCSERVDRIPMAAQFRSIVSNLRLEIGTPRSAGTIRRRISKPRFMRMNVSHLGLVRTDCES